MTDGRGWEDRFPFVFAPNGDGLAIMLEGEYAGKVVDFCHDDEEENDPPRILGPDFETFFDSWSRIGCIGPDLCDYSPYYSEKEHRLDLESEAAQILYAFLGISS